MIDTTLFTRLGFTSPPASGNSKGVMPTATSSTPTGTSLTPTGTSLTLPVGVKPLGSAPIYPPGLMMEKVAFMHARGLWRGKNTKNSANASRKIDENLARWKRAGDGDLPTFNGVPVDLLLEGEIESESQAAKEKEQQPPKNKRKNEREVVSESEAAKEKEQQPLKKKRKTV